ncbi:MAG: metallophosphoesterase family protein [Bacteroidia bacterium]
MKIGIISDTHSYMDDRIKHHLSKCDEIWHAGDFGDYKVIEELKAIAPLKGVYGNIDDKNVRAEFFEELLFDCEGMKVYMRHISGYPGKYNPKAKRRINELRPELVIVGHSHICKIIRDPYFNHIHINPGAAGVHGFHKIRTLALAEIENGKITDLKVVELGKRGKL